MRAPSAQTDRPPARVSLGDVVLARWRSGDLEPLFAAVSANLEHLRPWMAFAAHHGRDSIAQFLADSETGWEHGERFGYAIRYRRAGIVGSAGLVSRIGPGGLEIGYWVDARHTRRGIATLAAAALTSPARSVLDHARGNTTIPRGALGTEL
jgi:ribosomal-protein-serine acetyltransferase